MGVRRPAWWYYPKRWEHGHEWGPGRVLVSWVRCHCPAARAAHPDDAAWGYLEVACGEPGCRWVWCDPANTSATTVGVPMAPILRVPASPGHFSSRCLAMIAATLSALMRTREYR